MLSTFWRYLENIFRTFQKSLQIIQENCPNYIGNISVMFSERFGNILEEFNRIIRIFWEHFGNSVNRKSLVTSSECSRIGSRCFGNFIRTIENIFRTFQRPFQMILEDFRMFSEHFGKYFGTCFQNIFYNILEIFGTFQNYLGTFLEQLGNFLTAGGWSTIWVSQWWNKKQVILMHR